MHQRICLVFEGAGGKTREREREKERENDICIHICIKIKISGMVEELKRNQNEMLTEGERDDNE